MVWSFGLDHSLKKRKKKLSKIAALNYEFMYDRSAIDNNQNLCTLVSFLTWKKITIFRQNILFFAEMRCGPPEMPPNVDSMQLFVHPADSNTALNSSFYTITAQVCHFIRRYNKVKSKLSKINPEIQKFGGREMKINARY